MSNALLFGLLIGVVILALEFFQKEFFKQLIASYFKSASKKTVNALFIAIMVASFIIPVALAGFLSPASETENKPATPTVTVEPPKTDAEVITESVEDIVNVIDESVQRKREKKEEALASREKRWVYKIGEPLNDQKALVAFYKEVDSLDYVSAFDRGHGTYFLFIDDAENKTYEELLLGIEGLKTFEVLDGVHIEVIDLMAECDINREPIERKGIRIRGAGERLRCLECGR